MNVCEKCSELASRCIIWNEGKGLTETHYYCKNHIPKYKNS